MLITGLVIWITLRFPVNTNSIKISNKYTVTIKGNQISCKLTRHESNTLKNIFQVMY